jgi:hypothetical protein
MKTGVILALTVLSLGACNSPHPDVREKPFRSPPLAEPLPLNFECRPMTPAQKERARISVAVFRAFKPFDPVYRGAADWLSHAGDWRSKTALPARSPPARCSPGNPSNRRVGQATTRHCSSSLGETARTAKSQDYSLRRRCRLRACAAHGRYFQRHPSRSAGRLGEFRSGVVTVPRNRYSPDEL